VRLDHWRKRKAACDGSHHHCREAPGNFRRRWHASSGMSAFREGLGVRVTCRPPLC